METINVRSDNPSSIQKMKKHFSDPNKTIIAAIVADWCGACQQFKPIWEATIKNYIASQSPSKKKKQLILATIKIPPPMNSISMISKGSQPSA